MQDITILFLTVNKLSSQWVKYQKKVLLEAIGDTPIITISKKPLDWGINIIQDKPICSSNVYWQMLRGAKIAKTPYIAIAEDDVLYSKEHFTFRPKLDEFAYNMNYWGLFTWGEPTYFWGYRIVNSTLIAPRDLLINVLEERFTKYPDGTPEGRTGEVARYGIESKLGLPHYKYIPFYSTIASVKFHHNHSLDILERNHRKRMAPIRAYSIPYWKEAKELVKKFI